MARITLTVQDLDLEAGTYMVNFRAEGTEIDDGQATAAYFTGFYLNTLVNTPDFLDGARQFGQDLINRLTEDHPLMPETQATAKMLLTLSDADLATGRYHVTLDAEGGDMSGNSLPTTAQVIGIYMRSLLADAEFRERVWAFAEEFAANHEGCAIVNDDERSNDRAAA